MYSYSREKDEDEGESASIWSESSNYFSIDSMARGMNNSSGYLYE